MTTRSPPRVALWLLEGASGPWMEELVGDLMEQFAAGRSRLWFWYQAAAVLLMDCRRALRHASSFIAAVLAGYAVSTFSMLCYSLVIRSLDRGPSPQPSATDSVMRVIGLLVAQLSVTALLFASGWIVKRIHRAHQRAALVALMIVLIAPRVPALAQLVANVVDGPQQVADLVPAIMPTALDAVFGLVAGLWVIRAERFVEMNPRTRIIAVLTLVLVLGASILYDAWRVGVLSYPAAARYPLNAGEIVCGIYLALLLWPRESRPIPG